MPVDRYTGAKQTLFSALTQVPGLGGVGAGMMCNAIETMIEETVKYRNQDRVSLIEQELEAFLDHATITIKSFGGGPRLEGEIAAKLPVSDGGKTEGDAVL